MSLLVIGALVLLLPGAYALRRAESDFAVSRHLRPLTFWAVLLAYVGHAVATIIAAWQSAWPLPVDSRGSILAGVAMATLGGTLYALGRIRFGSFGRTWGLATPRLEVGGIYQFTRHPQTVGSILFFAGVSVATRSGVALSLTGLLAIAALVWLPVEERILEQLFGNPYREYRARTPKFFGWPGNVRGQSGQGARPAGDCVRRRYLWWGSAWLAAHAAPEPRSASILRSRQR